MKQVLPLPEPSRPFPSLGDGRASYCGIAWSRKGSRVWVTDAHDTLHGSELQADGSFRCMERIYLPGPASEERSAPGGLAVDEDGNKIYVALSRNNSIGVVSLETKRVEREIPVGVAPFTIILHDSKAYVTNWGGRKPIESDTTGPSSGSRVVVDAVTGVASTGSVSVVDLEAAQAVREIPVGLHPSGMALSKDGCLLFVANANSDTVSVIDTAKDELTDTIGVKPMPQLPYGSAPNAVAVAADGATLYVANGGNNAVAALDIATGKVTGFIPTGWYPGAVAFTPSSRLLLVANVKGFGSRGIDHDIAPHLKTNRPGGYNSHDYVGSVSIITAPGAAELAELTEQVAINMRLPEMSRALKLEPGPPRTVPVPIRPGEVSVFKHVLYIIKENRTYDQILGDMEQGNGDPSLCLFGREVTPNHHALAEEFVLFDHTSGTREGFPTPRAAVADNDLALGRIVEAVSKSRFWPETVIFVVEDDPQDGVDHVDGRRTVAFCISPYTKRRYVDSNHHNQNSLLRTMELILGLGPMTQLDMAANPLLDCFQETPDLTPYTARPNEVPLDEMNLPIAQLSGRERYYAEKSMELPLDDIDLADEGLFNRVLWHSVKGYDVPYPTPVRRQEAGEDAWSARNR